MFVSLVTKAIKAAAAVKIGTALYKMGRDHQEEYSYSSDIPLRDNVSSRFVLESAVLEGFIWVMDLPKAIRNRINAFVDGALVFVVEVLNPSQDGAGMTELDEGYVPSGLEV